MRPEDPIANVGPESEMCSPAGGDFLGTSSGLCSEWWKGTGPAGAGESDHHQSGGGARPASQGRQGTAGQARHSRTK